MLKQVQHDGLCKLNEIWSKTMADDQLARYRQSIDNIDAALVFMLAERFKITQAVGELKARLALPPADPGREDQQIERLRALARDANLDPEFSEKFLRFVIDEVIRHHERLREG
jgi:chorismate mutase